MYLPQTLIISDQVFFGQATYSVLKGYNTINVLDDIESYEEAMEAKDNPEVDVMLIVVNENSNFEHVRIILSKNKNAKKLILSANDNRWFLLSIIHMGAHGCFIADSCANKLAEAIVQIYHHNWFLPKALYNQLYCEINLDSTTKPKANNLNHIDLGANLNINVLTKREVDILQLMVKGDTSAEIAEQLFISESTVSTHRKHILKKLGFSNTPSLIRTALEHGVV